MHIWMLGLKAASRLTGLEATAPHPVAIILTVSLDLTSATQAIDKVGHVFERFLVSV